MNRIIFSAMLVLAATLAGCGSVKIWPFGSDAPQERARVPANAVEYQCPGGQRFHVRWLDGGGSAWLILSDREVRLDRSGTATHYSNGITSLDVGEGVAALSDRALTLSGCKTAAAN